MINLEWDKHRGLANIGISCGPSNLVVLDEDAADEIERWCAAYGITLPDTYTVTTGRGRHLYFRWDHTQQSIGNSPKAMDGFKIDVRGDGGFVVAEGSRHESGELYVGNGLDVAGLPEEVAKLLLADNSSREAEDDEGQDEDDDHAKVIVHGSRDKKLTKYAGRLRKSGLDYAEVLPGFRERWLRCEQPEGQIPEALFHSADCPDVYTWELAQTKLKYAFDKYQAGQNLNDDPADDETVHTVAWPTLDDVALYGTAGSIVKAVAPHTEADPAAILVQLLAVFGATLGSNPHIAVG